MAKSDKLYKDSPKVERDEDSGKMEVKTKSREDKADEGSETGTTGATADGAMPHPMRHAMERREMHHRHETEHSMMDTSGKTDKKEMHARHEKEMKEMHKRHEKEMGSK